MGRCMASTWGLTRSWWSVSEHGHHFCELLARVLSLSPSLSDTPVRVGGPGRGGPAREGPCQLPGVLGPGLMPQAGVRWAEVSGCPSLSRPPFFRVAQRCLDWNRDILKKELGLAEQDIIDLPALFQMDNSRQARAFFPNMVRRSGLWASPRPSGGRARPGGAPQLKLAEREAQAAGPAAMRPPTLALTLPGELLILVAPWDPGGAFTLTQWKALCKFRRPLDTGEILSQRRASCELERGQNTYKKHR